VETADSVTLVLEPVAVALPPFHAGQFTMLCVPGVGEVAISISGNPAAYDGTLTQTVRDVGAVSRALHDAPVGAVLGVRGPYGKGWELAGDIGHDLLVVAGGVGLAPLRPAVLAALARRSSFGRVTVVAGARRPAEFLFHDDLSEWVQRGDLDVELTVDAPAQGWRGPVGFVTEPLGRLTLDPARTDAFLCGPEPMMRFSAAVLLRKSVPADRIQLSLERNMQCGVALCGHCQLGPLIVCRDGPVVRYDVAAPLLAIREL
jgi:NAD(P)H-flavin reductase